jgi:DHA1 family solute carrier family 18 vesicular amine transporter 1/2
MAMKSLRTYPRIYYELLFIGFSIFLGMRLSGAFLPILAKDLDPSGTLVGYVVSAWFLARVFIEMPSGLISDRIGRRRLFMLGIGLSAVGSLMCALASSIYFLIAGRALWGFGAALFFSNNTAMLIDLFDSEQRGRAVGTFQGIEFIGSLIGAPIGALLAELTGYFFVFYITFSLISVGCLLAFLSKELRTMGKATGIAATSTPSLSDSLKSLMQWGLLVICVVSFTRMFVMNGVMSTVFPLYLHETLGFDVSIIGLITAARTGGFTAATILSGYLSDRIGRKKTILLGLVIEALCIYGYTVVDALGFIIPLGIVDGLGAGLVSVTLTVLLSYIVKSEFRGISIGLFRTFMDVGGIFGPIFFMALAEGINTRTAFSGGTVMLLVMAVLLLTIKQESKE